MMLHGGSCPKPTLMVSNMLSISLLDKGPLRKDTRLKKTKVKTLGYKLHGRGEHVHCKILTLKENVWMLVASLVGKGRMSFGPASA